MFCSCSYKCIWRCLARVMCANKGMLALCVPFHRTCLHLPTCTPVCTHRSPPLRAPFPFPSVSWSCQGFMSPMSPLPPSKDGEWPMPALVYGAHPTDGGMPAQICAILPISIPIPPNSTPLHYSTLHYTPLHYMRGHGRTRINTTLHYTPLHSTTPHSTLLHYTTLHYTTLHYTTLHSTPLHSTPLHHTAPHCTALHCTALHYM